MWLVYGKSSTNGNNRIINIITFTSVYIYSFNTEYKSNNK